MYMGMTSYNIMGQYGLQTKSGEGKKKLPTKQKAKGKAVKGILELGWREDRQSQKKEKVAAEGQLMPKKGEAIQETWQ